MKRIVGRLSKANDLRKTYIFFTSDNGLLLGAHRLLFKNYIYEESTRVPLIVRGPGFPAGVVRDQNVSNVDLAPTITALTGTTPGLVMDGRSLLPVAQNPAAATGRDVLFESGVNGGSVGVRSGQWVYIDNGPDETAELYNLTDGPVPAPEPARQRHTPSTSRYATSSRARLNAYRNCVGLSCP